MKTFNTATLNQHASMILDAINGERITDETIRDNEVHNIVFNTDYFIIGCCRAEKWIVKNFGSAFSGVDIVKEYEVKNFGEFTTDINIEKIANMLSFICGEHVLGDLSFDSVDELKDAVEMYIGE